MGAPKSIGWDLTSSSDRAVNDQRKFNYKVSDVASDNEIKVTECNCIIHSSGKRIMPDEGVSLVNRFGGVDQ